MEINGVMLHNILKTMPQWMHNVIKDKDDPKKYQECNFFGQAV